ncbi:MAG: deoxyribodipyrimidine photo-lyase [Nonlabens sp.]
MVVLWFKRDLRLEDNTALCAALSSGEQVLLVYTYEPSVWANPHYSERHERFIVESLFDLNNQLKDFKTQILSVREEAVPFFKQLFEEREITAVYSNEETGLDITYQRDIAMEKLLMEKGIPWNQYQSNGVIRGIRNRDNWSKKWYAYMTSPQDKADFYDASFAGIEEIGTISASLEPYDLEIEDHDFQRGGPSVAHEVMDDFFNNRIEFYSKYISKPEMSRIGCSRLSPYISWGNLSIRQIYQRMRIEKETTTFKRAFNAYSSRLRWQSHFIQKFEQEPRQEFEALNRAFKELPQPYNEDYVNAWINGQTGYPLVDANMRAVKQTGYINFRMRSMVVSFLTHHLFQHFTTGSEWLARQFLDFEAGIHYCQFQMQAALTGTNTVRIYNPTKNAQDHDPDAVFIKKYVPELAGLPAKYAIEPWLLEGELNLDHDFEYGVDYPRRIVDIKETRAVALKLLYGTRKSDLARAEKQRILDTHTIKRKR